MKTLDIADILALDQCVNYETREEIIAASDARWPKTLLEIVDLDQIPARYRVWLLLQPGVLDDHVRIGLGCDCVEHVLPVWEAQYPDDDRPRMAINTTRRWIAGDATADELDVAWAAAVDAGKDTQAATKGITWGTAGAAEAAVRNASGAAWAAAWTAGAATGTAFGAMYAWDAEELWQLERIKEVWDAEELWQLERIKEVISGR